MAEVPADEANAATLRWIRKLPELNTRAQSIQIGRQRAGSREAEDRVSPLGIYVGMLASIKLAIATDHLDTLHRAVRADSDKPILPTYAHYSLIRGAFEACIYTGWLLERDVSSKRRLGRALQLMTKDLKERRAAEDEVPEARAKLEATGSDARTRLNELEADALAADVSRSGDEGLVAHAKRYSLCGDALDAYHVRFLAGVLHGTACAAVGAITW